MGRSVERYPAHDYNGHTSSTIGEEKRLNPRLTKTHAEPRRLRMMEGGEPGTIMASEVYFRSYKMSLHWLAAKRVLRTLQVATLLLLLCVSSS